MTAPYAPASFWRRIPVAFWVFLISFLPLIVLVVSQWNSFPPAPGHLFGPRDPDTWLRLTLVRDWMQGGSWYSHAVAHTNAPFGGVTSPWTRPLDVVIAALTWLQGETDNLNLALVRTALMLPVLWLGLLWQGLYRLVRLETAAPSAAVMVSLLIAASAPLWGYFGIANADHHGLLAVLLVWALYPVFAPAASGRAFVLAGMILGVQLWVSPEALMPIAVIHGWYGILWLRGDYGSVRGWRLMSLALAAMTMVALMLERQPAQWLLPVYDSLSIVHVLLSMLVAGGVLLLTTATATARTLRMRVLLAICVAVGIAGVMVAAFPLVAKGPLAEADPYIFSHFMPRMAEARSPLSFSLTFIASVAIQPLLAAGVLLVLWYREDGYLVRGRVLQLWYFLCAFLMLYLLQQRFYYYLHPMLILVLAPFFAALFSPLHPCTRNRWPSRPLQALPLFGQAVCRMMLAVGVVFVPFFLGNLPQPLPAHVRSSLRCAETSLKLIEGGTLAQSLGTKPRVLLAPTDVGAPLLFFTDYSVVASNYHREGEGIRFVWEAQRVASWAALRRYFAERKLDAVLVCPPGNLPSGGIMHTLYEGKMPPAWLVRVAYDLPNVPQPTDELFDSTPLLFKVK